MVIILAVAGSDCAPIEDDIIMHGKRTAMSLAIPDLMSVNLLRIFNERNRRRRAAAIKTMYAKDCFFADAIESVSGWDGVHDKVDRLHAAHPGFVFNRAGWPSHITAWHVSDGGSGHRTPAVPSLASMAPSLKRASLKPYMSSLMAGPGHGSRPGGRLPGDLGLVLLPPSRRQNPRGNTPSVR